MHPFIGFTERTDVVFDVLHKIKDDPLLVVPGMETDRTAFAYLCQSSIQG